MRAMVIGKMPTTNIRRWYRGWARLSTRTESIVTRAFARMRRRSPFIRRSAVERRRQLNYLFFTKKIHRKIQKIHGFDQFDYIHKNMQTCGLFNFLSKWFWGRLCSSSDFCISSSMDFWGSSTHVLIWTVPWFFCFINATFLDAVDIFMIDE